MADVCYICHSSGSVVYIYLRCSFYDSPAPWKRKGKQGIPSYVNGRVNQMVESCEQGIETLAELPQAVSGPGYVLERNRIFQSFMGFPGRWDMNRKCIW